jgi:hypothetical protein
MFTKYQEGNPCWACSAIPGYRRLDPHASQGERAGMGKELNCGSLARGGRSALAVRDEGPGAAAARGEATALLLPGEPLPAGIGRGEAAAK